MRWELPQLCPKPRTGSRPAAVDGPVIFSRCFVSECSRRNVNDRRSSGETKKGRILDEIQHQRGAHAITSAHSLGKRAANIHRRERSIKTATTTNSDHDPPSTPTPTAPNVKKISPGKPVTSTHTRNKLTRGLRRTSSPDLLVSLPAQTAAAAAAVAATAALGCRRAERAMDAPPAPAAETSCTARLRHAHGARRKVHNVFLKSTWRAKYIHTLMQGASRARYKMPESENPTMLPTWCQLAEAPTNASPHRNSRKRSYNVGRVRMPPGYLRGSLNLLKIFVACGQCQGRGTAVLPYHNRRERSRCAPKTIVCLCVLCLLSPSWPASTAYNAGLAIVSLV